MLMKRRKRFAIVIGVAAAGVMALGAQTGAQAPAPTPPPPTCDGKPATTVGTDGSDQIASETTFPHAADVIAALGGNDTVSAFAANDVVCGGPATTR
jgi:hypothetical protein